MSDPVARAAEVVAPRLGGRRPELLVVLGSGLGLLAERLEGRVAIPYREIPGFHAPTVEGHKGELVAGELAGRPVLVQSGRFHLYEGHSPADLVLPVRVAGALGAGALIVTNAAGGIREGFSPGTIMLIADHLNLTGRNPLVGPVLPGETRFPDMTVAYDAELRALARREAARLEIPLAEGVYAGLLGPSYETPAEIGMLKRLGADAVGMSTVLEVIAARASGLRCLGFSTVTNLAAGQGGETLSHDDVMATAGRTGDRLARLIEAVVGAIPAPSGRGD
ncbi:MAG: purine-nucleoside phosphorylase [Gemmatimonadales bacterium]